MVISYLIKEGIQVLILTFLSVIQLAICLFYFKDELFYYFVLQNFKIKSFLVTHVAEVIYSEIIFLTFLLFIGLFLFFLLNCTFFILTGIQKVFFKWWLLFYSSLIFFLYFGLRISSFLLQYFYKLQIDSALKSHVESYYMVLDLKIENLISYFLVIYFLYVILCFICIYCIFAVNNGLSINFLRFLVFFILVCIIIFVLPPDYIIHLMLVIIYFCFIESYIFIISLIYIIKGRVA